MYGDVYNFWNLVYYFGGFFGGVGVVVVSKMVLIVGVSDGGGFIWILVFWISMIGFKLIWGWVIIGLSDWCFWQGVVGSFVIIKDVEDIVCLFDVLQVF